MKIIVRAEKSRLARNRPSVLLTAEMNTFGGCCLARRGNIRKLNNEKHREGSRVVCRFDDWRQKVLCEEKKNILVML